MKRQLITLLITGLISVSLVGCGKSYKESAELEDIGSVAKGYFTVVKQWDGGVTTLYQIVYANDTKVMYLIVSNNSSRSGITPLYNADGTLQIYDK